MLMSIRVKWLFRNWFISESRVVIEIIPYDHNVDYFKIAREYHLKFINTWDKFPIFLIVVLLISQNSKLSIILIDILMDNK